MLLWSNCLRPRHRLTIRCDWSFGRAVARLTWDLSQQLATGYTGESANAAQSGTIDGFFTPPAGACGNFRTSQIYRCSLVDQSDVYVAELIINEQQFYQGKLINFRAAAPSITINC